MADKRTPHNWENVLPGDIISFKYKSQTTRRTKLHTLLVLNPTLNKATKSGVKKHLIGLKIEEANRVSLQITKKQLTIFEQIGKFVPIDEKNNLYRLNIEPQFITNDIKGVKPRAYDLLSKGLGIVGAYRTYDYFKARNLYPNVDFYSGIIYKALGIPTEMFTVMFALGRLPGWIAQWKEMIENKEPIGRPRQIYVGENERSYVSLENR